MFQSHRTSYQISRPTLTLCFMDIAHYDHANAYASDGNSYPCPPYKLIILDEADSMTQDAQSALRRIMETYSRITRFCLVCNYVTRCVLSLPGPLVISPMLICRIIEPLASRCSKFRFRPLGQGSSQARIEMIAQAEGVDAEEGVSRSADR